MTLVTTHYADGAPRGTYVATRSMKLGASLHNYYFIRHNHKIMFIGIIESLGFRF